MPVNYPTLMDVARRSGDPKISNIVEILNKSNPILDDIPWIECNSGVTHITTIRTGIPTPTWRMLNSGVPLGKSTTKQIKAGCGMLEIYSEIDAKQVDLARRNGGQQGAADFLASENAAFIEGFGQEIARVFFYGDPGVPQEPVGLCNYYTGIGTAATETNALDGGGKGSDNTSIWLIQWGPDSIHGLYPQGSKAGLSENYKGVHTVKDANDDQFEAHRTHYGWDAGLVVRDWRSAVRVANVDLSDAIDNSSGAVNILTTLTKAIYKLPKKSAMTRTAIYMRKELITLLDLQCQNRSNLLLNYGNIDGKTVLQFRGIPIREQETLLASESLVS